MPPAAASKHKLSPPVGTQPDAANKRRRAKASTPRTRAQANNPPPGIETPPTDEEVVEALPLTVKDLLHNSKVINNRL
jgi:hypothetical protein